MPINRKSAPEIQIVKNLTLPAIEESFLSNGIPVYSIHVGTQEVVKIQLLFEAGIWYQSSPLQAYFTGQMLEEGSTANSATEIAEKLDTFGAHVHQKVNRDNASIDIYSLNKHAAAVIELVADMIKNPLFGEEELNRLKEQELQAFLIRNEKVKDIAQKQFNKLLYGDKHPYGSTANKENYLQLNPELLRSFHQKHYGSENCRIFISGKLATDSLEILDRNFGLGKWGTEQAIAKAEFLINGSKQLIHFTPKEKVLQSAIRMGQLSIGKKHKDYFDLSVVTTLFGGYFGSRLMSNIREDKGYTYGIYAGIYSNLSASSFMISTEVGADVAQKAVDEIRFELKRLRLEKVSIEELNLVKNYMSGSFLRSLNGPFALGEIVKTMYEYDLDPDYYQQYINQIHLVNPEAVLRIANQYLNEENMIELVVGKR
ncbi:MAG: insulinase family protein [Bacteroidales bacterium]|nr:insulinase family protein [Bacteroidales bacterium]